MKNHTISQFNFPLHKTLICHLLSAYCALDPVAKYQSYSQVLFPVLTNNHCNVRKHNTLALACVEQ